MPCSSSRRRILWSRVSSSGAGPPSDSDSPWQTKSWRSVNARNVLPSRPPTLIQFSGATSKKSMGASGDSCSGPKRARRRPSPAPLAGNGRMLAAQWLLHEPSLPFLSAEQEPSLPFLSAEQEPSLPFLSAEHEPSLPFG